MKKHRGTPKVTVFIPVYNRARYLCVAVNSILAQTFGDFELLLVDDGSTDGSLELLQRYAARDPRVRVEVNGQNLGIPRTRNRGLELARGEYIALLDSDDYAYPGRLAAQVAFLDAHPDHVQVGSWDSAMDGAGVLLPGVRRQPLSSADVDAVLLFRCAMANRSVMARTAVLREFRYREEFPRSSDYELFVRLAERHRMANQPAVLVCGRQHAGRYTVQTRDLGRERKIAIHRAQLASLGLRPSDADLERHFELARDGARSGAGGSDAAGYLAWAEDWLAGLVAANRRAGRYREASLARAVARYWAGACVSAHRELGAKALARLFRSPLLRMAAPFGGWRALLPAPALRLDPAPPAA